MEVRVVKAYKFLAAGSVGRFSDVAWPPPGVWLDAGGPLDRCRTGVHACLPDQFLDWLDDELWEVELAGGVDRDGSTLVAERGRLVVRVDGWSAETAHRFTGYCVARARAGAVTALREARHEEEADALERADGIPAVQAAVAGAAACDASLGAAVELAADCAVLAEGGRPEEWPLDDSAGTPSPSAVAANVGFVSAHAAASSVAAAGGDYAATFADERRRQVEWLRGALRI